MKVHAFLSILLAACLGGSIAPIAQAQSSSPKLYLNQRAVNLKQSPFTQRSEIFVPVQILEHMGFRLAIDPVAKRVKVMNSEYFYVLEEGSKHITWEGQGLMISKAPIWQDGTLFVPRSLFVNVGAILSYSKFSNEIRITQALNRMSNVEIFPGDVYTRLVFSFTQTPIYKVNEHSTYIDIELKGFDTESLDLTLPNVNDVLLKAVEVKDTGTGTARIRIHKAYASPHKVFWLKQPDRLVVDLVKIFQSSRQETVAKGIELTKTYQGFSFGPVSYYLAKISPTASIRLEPALGQEKGRGFKKKRVSQMAREHNALLAINSTYFNRSGHPLGLLMKNREFITSPIYGRTLLALGEGLREIRPSDKSLKALTQNPVKQLNFHAINLPRQKHQLALYTPRFGWRTGTSPQDSIELKVEIDGTVSEIDSHNLVIPADGYVVSGQGQSAQWLRENAYVGMRIRVFSQIWEQWRNVEHLVSGGPRLLRQGEIFITSQQERFQADIARGRAPRTALGFNEQGELFLLVVDGRQNHSRGLSLRETAQLLLEKGATEALNFDGGGSSTLVVKGQVRNQPSDGSERPVASALLVVPN